MQSVRTRYVSKSGIILASTYLAASILCLALTPSGDPKGEFVLKQIPLLPGLLLFEFFGLTETLSSASFTTAYLTIFPLTLFAIYAICHFIEYTIWESHLIKRLYSQSPTNPPKPRLHNQLLE